MGRERAVLMIPTMKRNPYHVLLARALEPLGWRVHLGRRGPILPIFGTWLLHGRPGIVHLHWTHSLIIGKTASASHSKAARLRREVGMLQARGVRVVWTIHNIVSHDQRERALQIETHNWLARTADAVTVHCESARALVAEAYGLDAETARRIAIVPHGNFIGHYNDTVSRDVARKALHVDPDAFVYLFLGDVKPYKGVAPLVTAFRTIRDPDARLIIAGSTSHQMSAELSGLASGDARILLSTERIADDDIQNYMHAADVVVLPFSEVLTSGSVLLAMSFGKALIVPAVGCVGEIVDASGSVLLPVDWTTDDLRAALEQVRACDTLAMGKHNKEAAARITWKDAAHALDAVFRGVLD